MWSGASRRSATSEIDSLLQRLKAIEDTVEFSIPNPAARAVPATRAAGGSLGLMRWFSLGFACSSLGGGGIALLATLIIHPAEAKPSFDAFGTCTSTEPAIQSARMPEARQLWWNVPCSIDGVRPKLARAEE
jgi:hypothetical protein